MATRSELLAAIGARYGNATRAERTRILDEFTARLKVAWSAGERHSTHRRPYVRPNPTVRASMLDNVHERIEGWPEVQPALTAFAVLERLRDLDAGRLKPNHLRTVQRFVKQRRAAMAREVLLGVLPPIGEATPRAHAAWRPCSMSIVNANTLSDVAKSGAFDGLPATASRLLQWVPDAGRANAVAIVFCRATPKPAAVLVVVKDKPFGWPPNGGHP